MSRVTFVDIAEKSIEECKNRYENPMRANFAAEFIHLDATSELISEKISNQENLQHDMVSSQFVIHYSFESFEKASSYGVVRLEMAVIESRASFVIPFSII